MHTFSSVSRMNELVAKANTWVRKLGLEPIKVISCEPRKVKVDVDKEGQDVFEVVFDAELEIPVELVKVGDQTVVARLQRVESQNMVTRIGSADVNLDSYRSCDIQCDHCKVNRRRNSSWVVANSDGKLIQVGDSCARLYFGVDVNLILNQGPKISSLLDSDGFSGPRRSLDFNRFVALVTWYTITSGYVSKKMADERRTRATVHDAMFLTEPLSPYAGPMERTRWNEENYKFRTWISEQMAGRELGSEILDWWLEREPASEFEHNCKLAIMDHSDRFLGLAAYAVKIWVENNFQTPEAEKRKNRLDSQWIGEIKERRDFDLKVTSVRAIDGDYGTTFIVGFEDEQGNEFKWFASSNPQLTLGSSYKIKGTIKKHSEYKGVKSTEINRCKVV